MKPVACMITCGERISESLLYCVVKKVQQRSTYKSVLSSVHSFIFCVHIF